MSTTISNAFVKILDESKRKPNKLWVDKGGEFYHRSMKSSLQNNDIEMYSTHNEENSIATERFIRIFKNKIYKYITSISKIVYIDKLDDIVNNLNNIYHSTIKMKSVDIKSNVYIEFIKEDNGKYSKFKIGDIV